MPSLRCPPALALALSLGLAGGLPGADLDALFAAPALDEAPLLLVEALARALENDPELEVSRLDPALAEHAADRDRAAWDPVLRGDYQRTLDRARAATALDGAPVTDTDVANGSLTLAKPLRDGGSVEGSLTHNRRETNSTFATLNPSYRTGVAVTLRKPVLRGDRIDASRRALRLSRIGLEQGRWGLRSAVLDTLASTERAYWNLAEARRRRDVAQLSLDEARTLLGASRARVEAGALAPIDVVEAEAAVTERRAALVQSLRLLAESETALLRRLAPELGAGQRPPPLADAPGARLPPAPPLAEVLALALEQNPRYRLARLELEAEEVQLRFARDALLPQLDVVATLQANGVRGDLGPSFTDVRQLDFPRYFVGLSWEVPLGRRAARAEHARRRTLVEVAVRRLKSQELALRAEAETALRRYRVDVAGMEVAAARVEAAGRKLDAERVRYEEGLITADDLLRFQRELAEARSGEVSARAQTARSALDLWVVTGTLARERGVAEADPSWQG